MSPLRRNTFDSSQNVHQTILPKKQWPANANKQIRRYSHPGMIAAGPALKREGIYRPSLAQVQYTQYHWSQFTGKFLRDDWKENGKETGQI